MWDPPRPGLEPVSPALAGRFSTTAPPGKPLRQAYTLESCALESCAIGLRFRKLCYWSPAFDSLSHHFIACCPKFLYFPFSAQWLLSGLLWLRAKKSKCVSFGCKLRFNGFEWRPMRFSQNMLSRFYKYLSWFPRGIWDKFAIG